MNGSEDGTDSDEQTAEDAVQPTLPRGAAGEAPQAPRRDGEEEPHDQNVDDDHGHGKRGILRRQRAGPGG